MKNKRVRVSSPKTVVFDGETLKRVRRKDKLLGVCPLLRRYSTRYANGPDGVIALDAQLGKQP